MLQLTVTIASLVSCLAVNEGLVPNFHMSLGDEGHADAACPPCEVLFSKLDSTGTDGKLSQNIKVQERGEPKSGTAVMYEWASGTLVWTCHYLQQLFGEKSVELPSHDHESLDTARGTRPPGGLCMPIVVM